HGAADPLPNARVIMTLPQYWEGSEGAWRYISGITALDNGMFFLGMFGYCCGAMSGIPYEEWWIDPIHQRSGMVYAAAGAHIYVTTAQSERWLFLRTDKEDRLFDLNTGRFYAIATPWFARISNAVWGSDGKLYFELNASWLPADYGVFYDERENVNELLH